MGACSHFARGLLLEGFYEPSSASLKGETFSYEQTENTALNPKLFFPKTAPCTRSTQEPPLAATPQLRLFGGKNIRRLFVM